MSNVFPEMRQFVEDAKNYLVPPTGILTYLRDKKRRLRGLVIAFRDGDHVFLGWSMYNKNKEKLPFSKELARAHAVRNARVIEAFQYEDTWDAVPHSLHRLVNEMLARAKNYFYKRQNQAKAKLHTKNARQTKKYLS